MTPTTAVPINTSAYFTTDPEADTHSLSDIALHLTGSEILKIAADIRARIAAGQEICNLTVGDFNPQQFPVPELLRDATIRALQGGQTNYPPSDGMPELRRAIVGLYERTLGLSYPVECVTVVSGARPALYAAYAALLNPGETLVYPVPSWNNNHYAHLTGAHAIEIPTRAEDGFLPTPAQLTAHLKEARVLALNTPLNPTGTAIGRDELARICELIVAENSRRQGTGERTLFLVYDHIYWMLTFGTTRHYTPPEINPAMAAYTIFVDGISKAFAATGMRVGWAVAPPHVAARMRDLVGHLGAWAPRAEQIASAQLLDDAVAIAAYHQTMLPGIQQRLQLLYTGLMALQDAGVPVDAIPPQGAIYLSARFDLRGKTINGVALRTDEDIRRYLLEQAGFAVVPFGAFGQREEQGWMRLSVGAASPQQIEAALPRVRRALAGH